MLLPREAAQEGAALRLRCVSDVYLGFDAQLQITGQPPDEPLPAVEQLRIGDGDDDDEQRAAEADWAARQTAAVDNGGGDGDTDAPEGACGA